jgi:MFS family permease
MGTIWSPPFWAFTIAIFICGAVVDNVGMRVTHVLSAVGYFVGVGLVLLAPHPTAPVASIFDNTDTTLLYAGFFVMGLSQGLVEGHQPARGHDLQRSKDEVTEPAPRVVARRRDLRRDVRVVQGARRLSRGGEE